MKYLILIAAFAFANPALSQTRITGRISSTEEKSLPAATVMLLRAADSMAVNKTVTNNEGLYQFEIVMAGNYLLKVSATGYAPAIKSVSITDGQPSIQLPVIVLTPVSKKMAGITITTKRPPVEQKIDRTIVNVEALVANAGVSALEVLENAPGVTVDKEGAISLKGKNGVIILIDGRQTQLAGADLVNLLRSMNSGQIDQLEIMTNPPAKYDASGTAGLINIKTKKAQNKGYNGNASVAYSQGRYPRTNESFIFNYRNERINWFTSLGHVYNSGFGKLLIQRKIFNSNNSALTNYFDQDGYRTMNGNSINGKMGLDYFINKKTTVGLLLNGTSGHSASDQANVTNISGASGELQQIVMADVDNTNSWKNFGANLNLRRLLNPRSGEITADLDYLNYKSRNEQYMVNAYFDESSIPFLKPDSLMGDLPQDIQLYSGRMDFVQPLKKSGRFEAGIKSSHVKTDNDAIYDSIQNGNVIRDINRSNHFIYEETIHAAYLNLNQSLSKKIGVQLGLRMEHTNAGGKQLTTGVNFTRRYLQVFPTAYFQYKLDEKNTLVLNYGRRIRRPGYQSLNPFIKFIDRYTYSSGNPDLKPELSDQIEVSHNWRNMISTTVNYTYTGDIFDNVIEQKGNEAYKIPANIASHRQFGLAINANTRLNKWWTSSIALNVFNNRYKGQVSNTAISQEATSFIISGIQQFKLSKTLTGEVNGRYRNGWYEGVIKASPVGFVGAGISKQMMKDKATLRLAVKDIFFSQQFRGESRYGNVDFTFLDSKDTRQVTLGFTYRFSRGKKISPSKKTTGSAVEEQERIEQ